MKIANEKSDALEIICRLHREIKEIQNTLSELEYLIYEQDERCKIEFFERGVHDEGRSEKGTKAD